MSIVNRLTAEVLNIRQPKQPVDTILKTVLFIKDRKSPNHPINNDSGDSTSTSSFEKTPTMIKNPNYQPFDEIIARSRVVEIIKQIVDYLAQERTFTRFSSNTFSSSSAYQYDEIFMQYKTQLVYNCCNYINAYYNNHDINSVDQIELAITSVWLSSKANSNFKRLDKILLAARHLFPANNLSKICDRNYYSCIEMDILQSLGFQLDIADDYPQKYITGFINKMTETCDAFRANLKKMKTICDVAMNFANQIANITPMMINRDSSVLAAACLYISNNFRPILNKENWWKVIENCDNLMEKKMIDTADLIYDVIKYSQNNWTLLQMQQAPTHINGSTSGGTEGLLNSHGMPKTINSPYSNYSSTSNQTSGFFSNGSSPHSSMVSLPSMLSPASSTFSQPINKMKTENQKLTPGDESWDGKSEGAVSTCSSISKNSLSEDSEHIKSSTKKRLKDEKRTLSSLVTEDYIFKTETHTEEPIDPRRKNLNLPRKEHKNYQITNEILCKQVPNNEKSNFSKPDKIPNIISHSKRKRNSSGGSGLVNAASSMRESLESISISSSLALTTAITTASTSKKRKLSENSIPPPPPPEERPSKRHKKSEETREPNLNSHRNGSPRPINYNIKNNLPSKSNTILTKNNSINNISTSKNLIGHGSSSDGNSSKSKKRSRDRDEDSIHVNEEKVVTSTSTPRKSVERREEEKRVKEINKRSYPTTPNKKHQKYSQDSAYKSISPLYDPLKVFAEDKITPKKDKERKREYSSHSNSSFSSFNSSVGSLSGIDLDQTLTCHESPTHPKEKNYSSRYDAIKNHNSVLMYYAKSSRYKSLSRHEKDLVKRKVNEIKQRKK